MVSLRPTAAQALGCGIYVGALAGVIIGLLLAGLDDLCTARRGGRTRVTVHLDSGRVAWLSAPYNGRWLAGDHQFERKLFMLRNQWETHRSFTVPNGYPPEGSWRHHDAG
jgi:hypothetical protein